MPRCFIVDPVCVFEFGHNPQQLTYYKNYFEARSFDVVALCGYPYSKIKARENDFKPAFLYYYEDFMPLSNSDWFDETISEQSAIALKSVADLPEQLAPADELEALAIADWLQIFDRFGITSEDHIFYPSVDFYGCIGLLKALAVKFKTAPPPHICLRFIGVMENATRAYQEPLRPLRVLLRHYPYQSRLTVSAESAVYARYLSKFFASPVEVSLYPLRAAPMPLSSQQPFVVLSAGSGREDKGFFRLLQIARRFVERYPEDDVMFAAQMVRWREEQHHPSEVAQMIAAPNIKLLPAVLSAEEIERSYADSHLLIAPYDFETYRCRGSAVTQEGVSKGRPVLITAHTGFHDLAQLLPTVHNCASDDDFCDHIHRYYEMERRDIEREAAHSASIYETRSFASIDTVFNHELLSAQAPGEAPPASNDRAGAPAVRSVDGGGAPTRRAVNYAVGGARDVAVRATKTDDWWGDQ